MNPDNPNAIEARRQALLGQLKAAESALRSGLHTQGFGKPSAPTWNGRWPTSAKPMIAINETKQVRTVPQLVDDLNRIQQVMDDARRGKSQRV